MEDASVNGGAEEAQQSEVDADRDRIRVLSGATDTAASFQFEGEDHTLGNVLRYIIMKNPDVEFCGYSIPHPSETKMNLRIQTYDGVNVYDVLEKGLDDLMDLCDVVINKFTIARDDFNARRGQTA
ncbi:DNA-directed RNA polymerase I and III 14 KDA polypeptide [Zopfia rhizophila CBS 207.26]|uniref:DNA-directed RNA polymerase I and III 14 kDa polypeptide n=1 Tax=Zopfia rhizophila CBS 207.26 TaxID=1314779 RepID=A0A6A6DBE5_9PEZI|nr:DNA-directed RNA polymerase I and III 14 KDA polypeptide [Zopfia rhizophila CBS 207.26]